MMAGWDAMKQMRKSSPFGHPHDDIFFCLNEHNEWPKGSQVCPFPFCELSWLFFFDFALD